VSHIKKQAVAASEDVSFEKANKGLRSMRAGCRIRSPRSYSPGGFVASQSAERFATVFSMESDNACMSP